MSSPCLRVSLLLALLPVFAACGRQPASNHAPTREVTVAAAANLIDVFQRVGPAFETQTGIHPVFSFAATAQLTQQIENGAPFDVFTAADSEHVDQLEKEDLLIPHSRAIYATGVLALWIPAASRARITRVNDLTSPDVRVIAIAQPELAPYGQAAIDTLERVGIWEQVKSKIVYAENINIARQYGSSGNADAVFTAYSLVLKQPGKVIQIDSSLHPPILQELGIPRSTQRLEAARRFVDFLIKGTGKSILINYGYK